MLEFEDVTVRYNGSGPIAVNGLSLSIGAGERVALIGPSGAGKSTILGLAAGLVLPSRGTVTVLGVDSVDLGRREHRATRHQIGTVRQDFALVGPLRVAQNVAAGRLGRSTLPAAMRTLMRPREVDDIAATLRRVGIADKLWDRADQLSGGQQQRAAIARALYQAPSLLLADEPVSALDPARSGAVLEVLMAAGEKRTVVASLHDAPLARVRSDRIIGLRGGAIQFDVAPSALTDEMLDDLYRLDDSAPS